MHQWLLLRQTVQWNYLVAVFVHRNSLNKHSRDKWDNHMDAFHFDRELWTKNSAMLNICDFKPEHVRVWPPSLFTKLMVLGFLFFFSCCILQHRICIITWSWDRFTCDVPSNPLPESDKSLQKISVSTSCLVLLVNFYFVMQQLSCCCWSTLQLHSS